MLAAAATDGSVIVHAPLPAAAGISTSVSRASSSFSVSLPVLTIAGAAIAQEAVAAYWYEENAVAYCSVAWPRSHGCLARPILLRCNWLSYYWYCGCDRGLA